ncbi:MAG: DNA/RNA nuclease SfsA [Candidatus Sumerlaeaceae bacterium]|nr:DNA/RNA nuclease SfsA [Candidatus Sumerlaeaceae bacterium]
MLPFRIERPTPLIPGTLLRRYKRFLADVRLEPDGVTVTAHCVNTGAMEGLTRPGTRVWLSHADSPHRHLKFTWETAEIQGQMVGVNTSLPNRVVGLLLREHALPWLAVWDAVAAERRLGRHSRVDFHLTSRRGRQHFLEVKNCHLVYPDGRAYFPDCVSERAAQHLRELAEVVRGGCSAEVLFVVQVPETRAVRPSDVHDPVFAATAREARAAGVRFSAVVLSQTPDAIIVERRIPVELRPYATGRVIKWRNASREE